MQLWRDWYYVAESGIRLVGSFLTQSLQGWMTDRSHHTQIVSSIRNQSLKIILSRCDCAHIFLWSPSGLSGYLLYSCVQFGLFYMLSEDFCCMFLVNIFSVAASLITNDTLLPLL